MCERAALPTVDANSSKILLARSEFTTRTCAHICILQHTDLFITAGYAQCKYLSILAAGTLEAKFESGIRHVSSSSTAEMPWTLLYTDRLGGESSRQWHRGHVATCGRAVRAARSSGMQIIDGRRRSPIHHPTSTTSVLTLSLIWSASACVSVSQPSDTCSCMRWHLDSRPTTLAQPA